MTETLPIRDVARRLEIDDSHLVPYGDDKAKIRLDAREASQHRGRAPGKLVLVSAITPTGAGEGKTTTSIGLAQGLHALGESVCLALREPSLGPTFGMKGGAIGGGAASLVPGEEINLHFTGDFHAITSAHNLLAAVLDNHLHQGNALGIDPRRVSWPRVMDMNDRALRRIVLGLGGPLQGVPRESGFDITAASEVMAILCLAEDQEDLRKRLERTLVAQTYGGEPVTAGELGAVGAMMVLLKDALMPNLVQARGGVPAMVHGGPFANIAHGCNSVLATKTALAHADWVVTEAGFAFDLGGEKFFDIKCRSAGLDPAAVVLVATIRALKRHGGVAQDALTDPDPGAVERGLPNLAKHIENAGAFGRTPVVALNRFGDDTDDEIAVVRRACEALDVPFAISDHFARGGEGATELARTVTSVACQGEHPFPPLYPLEAPLEQKLETIARRMYGAEGVRYNQDAEKDLAEIRRLGYGELPLCVAKTPASLSDDPTKIGRPEGFTVTVRGAVLAAGAGFVVPLLGSVLRMPGLPKRPQALEMDLVEGEIVGMR
jgi:formate--tetrahydrofolate ligase